MFFHYLSHIGLNILIRLVIFNLAFIMLAGCSHKISKVEVRLFNDNYFDVLDDHNRKANIYDNFGTKYLIQGVYFSSELIEAISVNHKDRFHMPLFDLNQSETSSLFLISIYSPQGTDLSDKKNWALELNKSGQVYNTYKIKHLTDKEFIRKFYPYANLWSQEYLIEFHTSTVSLDNHNMVKDESVSLTLNNLDLEIKLNWE